MSKTNANEIETIYFSSPQELLAADYKLPTHWRCIPCTLVIKESAFPGKFAASVQVVPCEVSKYAPRTVLRLFPKGNFPKGVDVVQEIETVEFDGTRHVLCRIANPHLEVDVEDHRLAIISSPPVRDESLPVAYLGEFTDHTGILRKDAPTA